MTVKAVCAEPGCPVLVEDTGPEVTPASYCPEHRILFEPESLGPDEIDDQIRAKLGALQSLRMDHVTHRTSSALLDRYNRVLVPAVERFVRLLQGTGRDDLLLELADIGYRITLDDRGELVGVQVRGWGMEPGEYGP